MLIDFGAKGTESFAALEAQIKEFEDLINSAENSLQVPKSLEPPRQRQVIPAIFPPSSVDNSSDDEETKVSRKNQLKNLEDLRAAVRLISQHRKTSPEQTGSDILSDDSDVVTSRRKSPMLRNVDGKLVKPALRPPRRRGRPTSIPDTPTFSKAVHFDSQLEHVKRFFNVDQPSATSPDGSPTEQYESESEFPFGGHVLERPVQASKVARRPASGQPLSKDSHPVGWNGKTNFGTPDDSDKEFPFNDGNIRNMSKVNVQHATSRTRSDSNKSQLPRSTSYVTHSKRTPNSNALDDLTEAPRESIAANRTKNINPAVSRELQILAQHIESALDSSNSDDDDSNCWSPSAALENLAKTQSSMLQKKLKGSTSRATKSLSTTTPTTALLQIHEGQKKESFNYKDLPNPNSPTFGNRYDFGRSLSAAINAANSTLKDRMPQSPGITKAETAS